MRSRDRLTGSKLVEERRKEAERFRKRAQEMARLQAHLPLEVYNKFIEARNSAIREKGKMTSGEFIMEMIDVGVGGCYETDQKESA